jgi:hypothetical protein
VRINGPRRFQQVAGAPSRRDHENHGDVGLAPQP